MGHKTLIGGTAYDIKGGKTLINGTAYDIKKGVTLIGGTGYDISFGAEPLEVYAAPNTALSNGLSFSSQYGAITFMTTGIRLQAILYDDDETIKQYGLFSIPVDFTPYSILRFSMRFWSAGQYVGYGSIDTYSGAVKTVFDQYKQRSSSPEEVTFDVSAISGTKYIKALSRNAYAFTISGIYIE